MGSFEVVVPWRATRKGFAKRHIEQLETMLRVAAIVGVRVQAARKARDVAQWGR